MPPRKKTANGADPRANEDIPTKKRRSDSDLRARTRKAVRSPRIGASAASSLPPVLTRVVVSAGNPRYYKLYLGIPTVKRETRSFGAYLTGTASTQCLGCLPGEIFRPVFSTCCVQDGTSVVAAEARRRSVATRNNFRVPRSSSRDSCAIRRRQNFIPRTDTCCFARTVPTACLHSPSHPLIVYLDSTVISISVPRRRCSVRDTCTARRRRAFAALSVPTCIERSGCSFFGTSELCQRLPFQSFSCIKFLDIHNTNMREKLQSW